LVVRDWWLVIGELVAGGWSLVIGAWCLVIGGWVIGWLVGWLVVGSSSLVGCC
jgi:hypothetical protein